MRLFVFVALISLSAAGFCETLAKEDLVGLWETNWPTTKGEKGSLCIKEDFSSTFTRDFPESDDQRFEASEESMHCRNEICSFSYFSESLDHGYRVVVSGWEVSGTARLFGTLFMYRKGELFNGLPISFEKVNKLCLADVNADIPAVGIAVDLVHCAHNSPLLHSSSRLFRLFELDKRISVAPWLVNGLTLAPAKQRAATLKTCGYRFGPQLTPAGQDREVSLFESYKAKQ